MRPRLVEYIRRTRGWLVPAALLALAPKCVLCVLAYAGLGTALGLGGPEICGATGSTTGYWIAGVPVLAGAAVAVRKLRPHANPDPPIRP